MCLRYVFLLLGGVSFIIGCSSSNEEPNFEFIQFRLGQKIDESEAHRVVFGHNAFISNENPECRLLVNDDLEICSIGQNLSSDEFSNARRILMESYGAPELTEVKSESFIETNLLWKGSIHQYFDLIQRKNFQDSILQMSIQLIDNSVCARTVD